MLFGCSSGTSAGDAAAAGSGDAAATNGEAASTSKPSKDGFDAVTNNTVVVAGVEFSVPAYFGEPDDGDSGNVYYHAEPGQAFIMTQSRNLGDATMSREDFDSVYKDEVVKGILESSDLEVVQSVDKEIAGLSARVLFLQGNLNGTASSIHTVIFFNDKTNEYGMIGLDETDAAQYDYTGDFAKVIDSAKLVEADAAADTEAEAPAEEAQPESADEAPAESGEVDPELKAWLDSYEAFVDEYVAFMENYDPNDLSSMTSYLDMLQKYSDFTTQVDNWDTSSMSAADYAYYIEVTSRCAEKMLQVSYGM